MALLTPGRRRALVALLEGVAALALIVGLWAADRALTDGGTLGPERNAVRGGLRKLAEKPDARGVVVLGSSTSRDWMLLRWLADTTGHPVAEVVDGHINGCHQGCTLAEIRRLQTQGRRFEVTVIGLNQGQMCEYAHSKRVLQHRLLLPRGGLPEFWDHYLDSREAWRMIARSILQSGSYVLEDTSVVQRRLSRVILEKKQRRGRGHLWRRDRPERRVKEFHCRYRPEEIAYKARLTGAMLDAAGELADRTYLMILPDAPLAAGDPQVLEAWIRHYDLLEALVARRPWVRLVDLAAVDYGPEDFGDGFHLRRRAYKRQRRQFRRELARIRDEDRR